VRVAVRWKNPMIALSRVVMTIREKFADLRFWKSKYKDSHMVLLFIGVSEGLLNITESIYSQVRE
tara:strand:+ start:101 stop:295 length:195 start_codon:yes stop_codon:yes gene_type:complete